MSDLIPFDDSRITVLDDGSIHYLVPPTYEQWVVDLQAVNRTDLVTKRLFGFILVHGQDTFPEWVQAIDQTRYSPGYISNIAWVYRHIHPGNWTFDVSWSHYIEVAKVRDPYQQAEYLRCAQEMGLTREELRAMINGSSPDDDDDNDVLLPITAESALSLVLDFFEGRNTLTKAEMIDVIKKYLKRYGANRS